MSASKIIEQPGNAAPEAGKMKVIQGSSRDWKPMPPSGGGSADALTTASDEDDTKSPS